MSITLVTKTPILLSKACPQYYVRLRGGALISGESSPWYLGFRYTCAFNLWYTTWVTCRGNGGWDFSLDIGCMAGYTGIHYVMARRVSDGVGASKQGPSWSSPC
jgi:hypothetical protein